MAISSSSPASSYGSSFGGKSAPKASQPQFGARTNNVDVHNVTTNIFDSVKDILFSKKAKVDDDGNFVLKEGKKIIENEFSPKQQFSFWSYFVSAPVAAFTASWGIKKAIDGISSKIAGLFKGKPKFEHAPKRY